MLKIQAFSSLENQLLNIYWNTTVCVFMYILI